MVEKTTVSEHSKLRGQQNETSIARSVERGRAVGKAVVWRDTCPVAKTLRALRTSAPVRDLSFKRPCAISGTRGTDGIGTVSSEEVEGNNRQLNLETAPQNDDTHIFTSQAPSLQLHQSAGCRKNGV